MAGERKLTLELAVDDQGSIKIANFRGHVDKTSKSIDSMTKSLSLIKLDAIINLGERAFGAANRVYDLAKSVASFGSDMVRTSQNLGMTIKQFQEWRYVAKAADVEEQALLKGIRSLTVNMADMARETGEAKKIFEQYSLSVKNADGSLKSVDQMITEIAKKFPEMGNDTERMAAMMKLFGSRSGEAFTSLMRLGPAGIEAVTKRFHDMGLAIDEQMLRKLADAEQAFKDLGFAGEKLKAALGPAIEWLSEKITLIAGNVGWMLTELDTRMQQRQIIELQNLKRQLKYFEDMKSQPKSRMESIAESIGIGTTFEERVKMATENIEGLKDRIKSIQESWKTPAQIEIPSIGIIPTGKLGTIKTPSAEKVEWIGPREPSFEDLYGMTETEFKDRMSYSKLMYEAWKEAFLSPKPELTFEDLYGMSEEEFKDRMSYSKLMGEAWKETYLAPEPIDKMKFFWENTITSMSNTFTSGFENVLIHGFDNIGDAFKDLAKMMLGELIKIAGQLMINQALYGSMMGAGGFESGSLFGGLFGLLGMSKHAEGGIFTQPTIGMIGERGPEAVIPLRSGKIPVEGGGNVYNIFNITAWDAKGVNHYLRHGGARQIAGGLKNDYNRTAGSRGNMIGG